MQQQRTRQFLPAAALLLAASFLAGCNGQTQAAPAAPGPGDEAAVSRALHDWADGYLHRDFKLLDRVRSDDWTYAGDPSGEVVTKKKADEMFRADASTRYLNLDYDDVKVRFYGNTAVVTAAEALRWENTGKVDTASYRLTAVFVKQSGDWRCVASHSSPIDKKK